MGWWWDFHSSSVDPAGFGKSWSVLLRLWIWICCDLIWWVVIWFADPLCGLLHHIWLSSGLWSNSEPFCPQSCVTEWYVLILAPVQRLIKFSCSSGATNAKFSQLYKFARSFKKDFKFFVQFWHVCSFLHNFELFLHIFRDLIVQAQSIVCALL